MNSPFDDLNKTQIAKIFNLTEAHIYNYHKGEELIPTFKNEDIIGIILAGNAQIVENEYNGSEIIKENLSQFSLFGTKISGTNDESVQIIAKEETQVVIIDYDKLINQNNLEYPYFNLFLKNIFDIINNKIKEKNERIKILKKKQIRERLLTFFEQEFKKTRSKVMTLSLSLKNLADYLAVDRSAMFREIKNLKEENIIKLTGRKITLLYK